MINVNKKVFISILICLSIGVVGANFLYKNYKKEELVAVNNKEYKVYFVQIGAYKNYDNVGKITKVLPSYVVKEEDGFYKIFVGITMSKDNLDKLVNYYSDKGYKTIIKVRIIKNGSFLNILRKYDCILKETSDYEMISSINKSILKKYKEMIL